MSREMRLEGLFFFVLLVAAAASQTVWAAEKSTKLATVRIGYVSRSILDMPYIIARDRGFFREEGLEPELIFIKAAQTIPAMLAGGIDFGTATGTGISAAVSGVDVRLIFALTDRPSFDLIAVPSITSVQQLRGKKLGTSGVGSLAEILGRQILIANKIPLGRATKSGNVVLTPMCQIARSTIPVTSGARRPRVSQRSSQVGPSAAGAAIRLLTVAIGSHTVRPVRRRRPARRQWRR